MIYEQIPDITIAAVRSIYQVGYIDLQSYSLAGILNFIHTNQQVAAVGGALSLVSLIVCLALGVFIVFVFIQRRALQVAPELSSSNTLSESASLPGGQVNPLHTRWNTIIAHLDSSRETDWKMAVLEADTLTDDALARAGFPGATFGDRLSNINPGTLVSLDGAWWAHKIRNRLAHESDYFLRYTEARQAVGYYQAVLTELNLL